MKIKIHKQFTKCFSKFDSQSQGLIIKTVLGIKNETNASGLRLHKVGEYYSYSVNMNLRLLTLVTMDEILLVYVGNHDETYDWGAKNKPVLTDKNIVGFLEEKEGSKGEVLQFENTKYQFLKEYGFDENFIRYISTLDEDQLLSAIEFIAPEYQELILFGNEDISYDIESNSNVIVVNDDIQLENALRLSIENWSLFLHPKQRYILDYPNWKNLMVKGGPGTGKTVALVHRFVKEFRIAKGKKPVFLCYNEYTRSVISEMLKHLSENAQNKLLVFEDFRQDASGNKLAAFFKEHNAIFIDEAQDMPIYFVSRILYLLENNEYVPPMTLAFDLNQSLFSSIGEAIRRLGKYFDIINLDYCYRSTIQIINKSMDILKDGDNSIKCKNFQEQHTFEMSKDEDTKRIFCALSGDEVLTKNCKNVVDLLDLVNVFVKEEKLQAGATNWAIIFSGRTYETLMAAFGQYQDNVYSAYAVKGREFFKGIVIRTNSDDEVCKTAKAYKAQVLTDYVSLSRFREKVLYINYCRGK